MRQECCVCLEDYTPEYFRTLQPCLHQLCQYCMDRYTSTNEYLCPLCRQVFDLDDHVNVDFIPHGETNVPSLCTRLRDGVFRVFRFIASKSLSSYISCEQRDILILHEHSTHVRAARSMQRNLPPHTLLKMVDLQTRAIDETRVETLVSDLMESTHNRIYNPYKYSRYFR